MKVFRNITTENKIKELLSDRRRLPPKSYSVTRLTCCPRKTYCRMVGIPELPTEGRELIFTRGKAHHEILEVFKPNEVRAEKDGIPGHIDMIGKRVTEIFTTAVSSSKIKKEEDIAEVFKLKVKQLKAYLHMVDELEGDLLVFFLFGDYKRLKLMPGGKLRYVGITPELKDWTFVFEPTELERNWNELLTKRDVIEECKQVKVPESILSLMPRLRELWLKWREGELSKEQTYELIATRKLVNEHLTMPDWVGEDFECKGCSMAYVCPEWNKEVFV